MVHNNPIRGPTLGRNPNKGRSKKKLHNPTNQTIWLQMININTITSLRKLFSKYFPSFTFSSPYRDWETDRQSVV